MRYLTKTLLAVMLMVGVVGCTNRRVDSELAQHGAFYLEVYNPLQHAMGISFTVGDGEAVALGEVAAGQTQRFTMPTLTNSEISLTATQVGGTHTVHKTVDLERGEVVRVSLAE